MDLIFRYLNLNLFDKVVMKVTHAGNAITRRHHRGHPWSDETDQKVVVTRSLTKVCNALVSFCEMANIQLPSHPLQDMIDDRRLPYVVDLSPEDERQWDERDQGIKDGTIKLGGLYNYKYNQTEKAIQKRHDAAVKAYQTNADNDTGIYHFTNDPSPEGAAKRHDAAVKRYENNAGLSRYTHSQAPAAIKKRHDDRVKAYKNNTGLSRYIHSEAPEDKKKRSNVNAKTYKNNSGLHDYVHGQSPKAKKKRSDTVLAGNVTRGAANWSPYNHDGTPVDPLAELQARAADPRFQGTHRGMPCVQWSKVQDSDDCIYLNDGNNKQGKKATAQQAGDKWTKMKPRTIRSSGLFVSIEAPIGHAHRMTNELKNKEWIKRNLKGESTTLGKLYDKLKEDFESSGENQIDTTKVTSKSKAKGEYKVKIEYKPVAGIYV